MLHTNISSLGCLVKNEVVFHLKKLRSSSIFKNIEVAFHISSSWVKIRLHTKNQLPRLSGSAVVWCGWGGVGGPTNYLVYPNLSWSWFRLRFWLGCDNFVLKHYLNVLMFVPVWCWPGPHKVTSLHSLSESQKAWVALNWSKLDTLTVTNRCHCKVQVGFLFEGNNDHTEIIIQIKRVKTWLQIFNILETKIVCSKYAIIWDPSHIYSLTCM